MTYSTPTMQKGTVKHLIDMIGKAIVHQFLWTCDSSGDVIAFLNEPIDGYAYSLETIPLDGPTDNYDVTLRDTYGVDILGGNGANRDTAEKEVAKLFGSNPPVPTSGAHKLVIAGAGTSKSGMVRLFVIPPDALSDIEYTL